jgi:ABC-type sugar transport system substrate-binding protein
MTDKETQINTVKAALLNNEPVNAVVMFNARITRLSAIIKRLRDRGYPIITQREHSNGLAHYSLPEGWSTNIRP